MRSRLGMAALFVLAISVLAFSVAMGLGPSAVVPRFGPRGPFLFIHAHPSWFVVTALTWTAAATAGIGVLLGLYALRRGSFVSPRRLIIAGAVAAAMFVLLPPAGSIDILNYAIYGRIAALHHDPYVMTPLRLARTGDKVGHYLPPGWKKIPTVYGPVATGVQLGAARFGGNSMAQILFALKACNAVAFLGVALILDRLAGPDPARRIRACLLWVANPLMLFWMVGSGHADALAAFALVASFCVLPPITTPRRPPWIRRSGLAGGVLAGIAVAIKVSFVFPVACLPLVTRRRRDLLTVPIGVVAVAGTGYLVAGRSAISSLQNRLGQTRDHFLPVLHPILHHHVLYAIWMTALAIGLTGFLWWRLMDRRTGLGGPPPGGLDFRPVLVIALGTTLASPLQYPWYDAIFLPLVALVPGERGMGRWLTGMLVIRGAAVSLCTLPGVRVGAFQHFVIRWFLVAWLIALFVMLMRPTPQWRRLERKIIRRIPMSPRPISTTGIAQTTVIRHPPAASEKCATASATNNSPAITPDGSNL